MKFRRRKPLPEPLQVPPQHKGLAIPYAMCDWPRQILNWLAQYSELTERQRELIAELLLTYNMELASWILMNYGYGGLLEADAISKEVAESIWSGVDSEYKERETSLFERLEKEMGSGGEDE